MSGLVQHIHTDQERVCDEGKKILMFVFGPPTDVEITLCHFIAPLTNHITILYTIKLKAICPENHKNQSQFSPNES